jgi:hypothetical protein
VVAFRGRVCRNRATFVMTTSTSSYVGAGAEEVELRGATCHTT